MIKLNFKMGADPECQVLSGKAKIDSEAILTSVLNDHCNTKFGEIGEDHNSILELRPKPGTPEEVAGNIGGMIKLIGSKAPYLNLSTLAFYSSVGGHVHFEVPKDFPKENNNGRETPNLRAVREVSKALGAFYLPVMMSENKVSWKRRLQHGYGTVENFSESRDGALRLDAKGTWPDGTSLYTIEFRTPSAEWIMSEKIAKATLAYLATVYYQCLNKPQTMKKISKLFWQTNAQAKAFQHLVLTEHKLMTQTYLKHIAKAIRQFDLYPQYKGEIEYILNHEKVFREKIALDYDPMIGWNAKGKLGKYTAKDAQKTVSNFDEGPHRCLLAEKITYNSDTNVNNFALALAKSVYQAKASLKNNYCLFGIRQGINEIFAVNSEYLEPNVASDRNKLTLLNGTLEQNTDKLVICDLFQKMDTKFRRSINGDSNKNMIIIALPYQMRMDQDYKPLLELVAKLEANAVGPELTKPTIRAKEPELGDKFKAFYPEVLNWEDFKIEQRYKYSDRKDFKTVMKRENITLERWHNEKKEIFEMMRHQWTSSFCQRLADYLDAKYNIWRSLQPQAKEAECVA